jgi:hypothetical protein
MPLRDRILLPALALLLGCGPIGVDTGDDGVGDGAAKLRITLVDGGQPAATAAWRAVGDAATRVEITGEDGPWSATDWFPAGEAPVKAMLLGLLPDAEWTAQLRTEAGDITATTTFRTPALPPPVPTLELTGEPGWEGWLLTSALDAESQVLLLDARGRVLWFTALHETPVAGGRVRPRQDGRGVWYAAMGEQPAELVSVSWDGRELSHQSVDGLNHDYTELIDGSFVWNTYDCRKDDALGRVCGNAVRKGDPGTEGELLFSTWDEFDPLLDGDVEGEGDWTHCNALFVDETRGSAWLGSRNFGAILELDLTTGEVLTQVGGPHTTLEPTDDQARTLQQHRFDVIDENTLLVHDNSFAQFGSRAVELKLDRSAGTVEAVAELRHDPDVWVYALGDVDRADDGSTLVTWSTSGLVDDFAPDGTLRASIAAELGVVFGYTNRLTKLPGMVPWAGE